jgi:hypothetical protein
MAQGPSDPEFMALTVRLEAGLMATRDLLFDIVYNGTLEAMQQALQICQHELNAAVCVFHPETGLSLLSAACWLGRVDLAAALVLRHGHPVDLAEPKEDGTALHQMCSWGRTKAALFLLRTLGANPLAVTKAGNTALHHACQGGHTELARILVRDFD